MRSGGSLVAAIVLGGVLACESGPPSEDDAISVGLLLSYSGYLAANSINSERALIMAVDRVNAAGGVAGRRLRILAKDTRSDPTKVLAPAQALLAAGAALIIGPDSTDLATQLQMSLKERTLILPSSNTASDVEWKPDSWFVMGAGTGRVACELVAQLKADGRTRPLLLHGQSGQNVALSWDLGLGFGFSKLVLPTAVSPDQNGLRFITNAMEAADSIVLAALPTPASALIYSLSAIGALPDPGRWYLAPTLHTPAFLQSLPKGALEGARGVSPGTVGGAAEFRTAFAERWQDDALDDAYPFYDAAAVVGLALARAMKRDGFIPGGTGLGPHIVAVTRAGGTPVTWDQLAHGLALVAQGREIEYVGLSGLIQFNMKGRASNATTKWWTIGEQGFTDIPHTSDCK